MLQILKKIKYDLGGQYDFDNFLLCVLSRVYLPYLSSQTDALVDFWNDQGKSAAVDALNNRDGVERLDRADSLMQPRVIVQYSRAVSLYLLFSESGGCDELRGARNHRIVHMSR